MADRGIFVNVLVGQECTHSQGCRTCLEVCPVDIFKPGRSVAEVDFGQEDECILCTLCVERCPAQVVQVVRRY